MLLLAPSCLSETPAYEETKVLAYAKAIDVAQLDPTLPSQPLDEWLRLGPAHVEKLQWRISSCGLKPDYPEPPGGYPLCVDFVYQRSRVAGWGIVTVGTTRKGIVKPPRFEYVVGSAPSSAGMKFDRAEKLAELPQMISKVLAQTQ
jgi:hypothetical protein